MKMGSATKGLLGNEAAAVMPMAIFGLLLFCIVAYTLNGRKKKREEGEDELFSGIPMVPSRHWLYGHQFYPEDGDRLTRQFYACVKYADPKSGFSRFYMFRQPMLAVNKVDSAQKVLRTNTYKASMPILNRLVNNLFGKNNVLLINGREWKIHRSPVTRALTSEAALIAAQRHILDVGSNLVLSLLKLASENTNGQARIDIGPVMKMATIDVFAAAALGRDLGSCKALKPSPVAASFDFLMADMIRRFRAVRNPSTFLFWIPTEVNRKAAREKEIVRSFLVETVHMHMDQSKDSHTAAGWSAKNNLLSQMIALKCRNGDVDVEGLVESMLVLLFAGYDTTANGLSFAFHEISTHPDVEEKCVAEAKTALKEMEELARGSGLEDSRYDVLKHFPYCHAALMESLRLYPPAVSTRRSIEKDIVLEGIRIPSGTVTEIPIYHIQRDEANFPRPTEFIPERWVRQTSDGTWAQREVGDDEKDGVKGSDLPPAGNRDAFLTFSSGARNCAGKRFSLQEGTLLLAVLLRDLKFKVKPGYDFKPVLTKGPILQPSDDLPMIVSRRNA